MPKIDGNRAVFYASWGGKVEKKDGTVFFNLELSSTEMSAAVFLWGSSGSVLDMTILVEDQKIEVGPCSFQDLRGKKELDSVIKFVSDLASMKLTKDDLLLFQERLLGVKVVAQDLLSEEE